MLKAVKENITQIETLHKNYAVYPDYEDLEGNHEGSQEAIRPQRAEYGLGMNKRLVECSNTSMSLYCIPIKCRHSYYV